MGKESHYSSKKDRVFVRGIQGQYSLKDELKRLRAMPRVIKGKDLTFNDGPQSFSKHFVEPVDGLTQTLHVHLEEYAPGGRTQKHGHVNEAAFYILDGVGVAKQAPHPHAAVLFYDFEISPEGQKILAGRDFVPTSKKVDTPLNKIPMKFVDARVALDEFQKWEKLYEDIFLKRAK